MELEEAIESLENLKILFEIEDERDFIATPRQQRIIAQQISMVLKYLEKYRDLYMQSLANNLNQSLKNREMSNEQLESLNEGWKLEVEKKVEGSN